MRLLLLALALFAFTAPLTSAAHASSDFTSPGWYVVEDSYLGAFLERGPYDNEDSCKASLPADDEETDYYCQYLSTRPDGDE